MPDHELVLLTALIADGNLTERSPRFCSGPGSPVLAVVEEAARAIGVRISSTSGGTAILSNGRGAKTNPVTLLMKHHGQWGRRSHDKFVPDRIFRLGDEQIARFLSVLYACDGHVHVGASLRQIGYTSISPALATGVQHLLLRLGIVSKIRVLRRSVYEGTDTQAFEVLITGQTDLTRFCEQVPVIGKEQRLGGVLEGLAGVRAKTNVDTLPSDAWAFALAAKAELPWAEVSAAAGRPRNHNWHVGSRGMSRGLAGELGAALASAELTRLATSDVWWDEIVAIEEDGEDETFDIEVPGLHNFVADDIVVHNSALMANFAEHAALHAGAAVAMFSLEMSETELAQRFIASQASVKGDDLRKGRIQASRWPKIYEASNRLAQSPLYIDDSSELSVLDVRAKSRRLAQQQAGGLGLVLIDYLQLMRADGAIENRVEQIGQISRGLKQLARELDVPVIALSQLNRGVEQRTDKKPLLSDLRESGSIEQDADLVMFIYRDEYYNKDESEEPGLADLIISKHRNGGLGDVKLTFQKEYPRFMSYAGDPYA